MAVAMVSCGIPTSLKLIEKQPVSIPGFFNGSLALNPVQKLHVTPKRYATFFSEFGLIHL